jgi:RNA polymerase sigma factor (sigma-70 family)
MKLSLSPSSIAVALAGKQKGVVMDKLGEIIAKWKLDCSFEEEIRGAVGEDWEEGQIERYIIGVLLKNGDEGFECIAERSLSIAARIIERRVPREDVEDVKGEFLMRLFKKIGEFAGRGRFDNWLRKLAKSVIADWYRDKPVETLEWSDYEESVAGEGWEEEMERESLREEVRKIIGELPPKLREVGVRIFIEGKSIPETAKELGKAIGTVCSQCSRIKELVKEKLEKFLQE